MTHFPTIDMSTGRVLLAIEQFGKSRLAARAGIAESNLRGAGREGWNPTAATLRKLEIAASELEIEDGASAAAAHRESDAPIPDEAAS